MRFIEEFKEFAIKGNVMDLAVGVIIGGAFGKITASLVDDVIMPIIAALMGGKIDFSNRFIALGRAPEGAEATYAALKEAGVPVLAYGNFITVLLNFILLAFIVFLMVKALNRLRKQADPAPAAPEAPPEEILLLREISQKLDKR